MSNMQAHGSLKSEIAIGTSQQQQTKKIRESFFTAQ